MIYLTKHETTAAYNAVKDNLAKPHVALIEETNKVDYQPTTPPTPQSLISAITIYDEESFETPSCGYGSPTLYFSRPVSFNELQNLEIEVCYCWEHEEGKEPIRLTPYVSGDCIEFRDESEPYYMTVYKPEESAINSIDLNIDDNGYWFNRIYLQ